MLTTSQTYRALGGDYYRKRTPNNPRRRLTPLLFPLGKRWTAVTELPHRVHAAVIHTHPMAVEVRRLARVDPEQALDGT